MYCRECDKYIVESESHEGLCRDCWDRAHKPKVKLPKKINPVQPIAKEETPVAEVKKEEPIAEINIVVENKEVVKVTKDKHSIIMLICFILVFAVDVFVFSQATYVTVGKNPVINMYDASLLFFQSLGAYSTFVAFAANKRWAGIMAALFLLGTEIAGINGFGVAQAFVVLVATLFAGRKKEVEQ